MVDDADLASAVDQLLTDYDGTIELLPQSADYWKQRYWIMSDRYDSIIGDIENLLRKWENQ